jgi:hypothetical protein
MGYVTAIATESILESNGNNEPRRKRYRSRLARLQVKNYG